MDLHVVQFAGASVQAVPPFKVTDCGNRSADARSAPPRQLATNATATRVHPLRLERVNDTFNVHPILIALPCVPGSTPASHAERETTCLPTAENRASTTLTPTPKNASNLDERTRFRQPPDARDARDPDRWNGHPRHFRYFRTRSAERRLDRHHLRTPTEIQLRSNHQNQRQNG